MFKDFLKLTKFVLSFAVSLSALFAYIMAKGEFGFDMLTAALSVLVVSMGVAAINQAQEYKEDALMARTQNRPIAAGRISVSTGMLIGIGLILLSFILVYPLLGLVGINLFGFAFIWYNFVYTPLKKVSALAVVPGALLGVVSPAVGWLAAGHSLYEAEFIVLGLYYFIWQVPHFWLLVMLYSDDYTKGGFPTATKLFGEDSLQRLTFVWINLTIYMGAYMVYIFEPYLTVTIVLSIFAGIYAFVTALPLLKRKFEPREAKILFMKFNMAFLIVIILLCIDAYVKYHP